MLTEPAIATIPSARHSNRAAFVPLSFRASTAFPGTPFDPYSNSSRESVTGQRIVPHRFSSTCGRPESFLIVFLVSLRGRRARIQIRRVAQGSHYASLRRRAQGRFNSPPRRYGYRAPAAQRGIKPPSRVPPHGSPGSALRHRRPASIYIRPPGQGICDGAFTVAYPLSGFSSPLALWERGRTAGPLRAAAASPCDMSRREG
jgi:hypothetical protein